MIDKDRIAELLAIEKTMEPAPWSTDYLYGAIRHITRNVDSDAFASEDWGKTGNAPGRYDGTPLAKLRNSLPELLDTLTAALRVVAAAKAFKYACDIACEQGLNTNGPPLDEALKPFSSPGGKGA